MCIRDRQRTHAGVGEHREKADQAQIGSFFAFFVISVVKIQAAFGTTDCVTSPQPCEGKALRRQREVSNLRLARLHDQVIYLPAPGWPADRPVGADAKTKTHRLPGELVQVNDAV